MAKFEGYKGKVKIGGVEIPNMSATFSPSVNLIEDTNKSTSGGYHTRLPGLKDWNLSASQKASANQGYLTTVKTGGTPTAVTGEACTLVSGKTYQITAAKRVWDESVTPVVYDLIDYVAAAYKWTASGSGTNEFYCDLLAGGDPSIAEPDQVLIDGAVATEGTLGSLSAGEWGYGDNDTLGYSTLYVRLSDDADPDSKADGFVQAGNSLSAGDIDSFDYLFGKVTLASGYTVLGSIGVDVTYIPVAAVAQANSYGLDLSGDVKDVTDYETAQANGGWRVNAINLIDTSLTIERFQDFAHTFYDLLVAGTPALIEIVTANGALTFRGWYVLEEAPTEDETAEFYMESLSFQLYGRYTQNFGYEATASLNAGLKAIFDSFTARTAATLQWTGDGSTGFEMDGLVSSISLSGELEGVDEMNVEVVSAGAPTKIP